MRSPRHRFRQGFHPRREPGNREYLFRWPILFFSGALSVVAAFVAYLRDRIPRMAIVALITLLGAYVLHAAVFSQLVALHPYLFDPVLVPPLILALFGFMPALAEARTGRTGLITLVTFLTATWTSFYSLRIYAPCYPLAN